MSQAMEFEDDILGSFIEDTREHLAGIEASLMDLEQSGANADPELVNTIFRAAHSIKGGAGFLGLDNVRDLAHKLENVLHMVRGGEIVPDNHVVSRLLTGFDLLRSLVEDSQNSNNRDISQALADLVELATGHLPQEDRQNLARPVNIPLPGGGLMAGLDRLGLEQALQGGKYLYLVEYDLIHDVHARGKTPLDVISIMESSGLIVDCRMDLPAVGDLDSPPTNRIPFFLLYATIVEPDVVGYLFALDSSRITVLDHKALLAGAQVPGGRAETEAETGTARHEQADPAMADAFRLDLSGGLDVHDLDGLKRDLLEALAAHEAVVMDLGGAGSFGTPFVQFACAAQRSFSAAGKTLLLAGAGSEAGARLVSLGFFPGSPGFPDLLRGFFNQEAGLS